MDLFIEKTGTKVSYEKGYFILENKDEKTKKFHLIILIIYL